MTQSSIYTIKALRPTQGHDVSTNRKPGSVSSLLDEPQGILCSKTNFQRAVSLLKTHYFVCVFNIQIYIIIYEWITVYFFSHSFRPDLLSVIASNINQEWWSEPIWWKVHRFQPEPLCLHVEITIWFTWFNFWLPTSTRQEIQPRYSLPRCLQSHLSVQFSSRHGESLGRQSYSRMKGLPRWWRRLSGLGAMPPDASVSPEN